MNEKWKTISETYYTVSAGQLKIMFSVICWPAFVHKFSITCKPCKTSQSTPDKSFYLSVNVLKLWIINFNLKLIADTHTKTIHHNTNIP